MTLFTHPVATLLSLALVATLWGTTLAPVTVAALVSAGPALVA